MADSALVGRTMDPVPFALIVKVPPVKVAPAGGVSVPPEFTSKVPDTVKPEEVNCPSVANAVVPVASKPDVTDANPPVSEVNPDCCC